MNVFRTGILLAVLVLLTGCPRGKFSEDAPLIGVPAKIKITLTGFRNETGMARVALFASPAGFPHDSRQAVNAAFAPIKNKQAELELEVSQGAYAIVALHDENNNQQMELNEHFRPEEGYGISHNATGVLGPPKYEDARFVLNTAESVMTLKMKY